MYLLALYKQRTIYCYGKYGVNGVLPICRTNTRKNIYRFQKCDKTCESQVQIFRFNPESDIKSIYSVLLISIQVPWGENILRMYI